MSPAAVPHREAFSTSRVFEYFSEKELTLQTGHEPARWAEVVVKELTDNALDACEEANIRPEIVIEVGRRSLAVSDNGTGIPERVITSILDFSSRTSSRDFYVSPTRGAQGNALKTVIAAPFVLSGGVKGDVIITTRTVQHTIRVTVDRLAQVPHVAHTVTPAPDAKGTRIEVKWPDSACKILGDAKSRFLQIVEGFAAFNPHAAITLRNGTHETVYPRLADTCAKWVASAPTSPHWYQPEELRNLLRAYVAHERQHGGSKTIREFISEFRGLSGTAKQKQILAALQVRGDHVRDLVSRGDVDLTFCERLLTLLQEQSLPVKPAALGILGEAHFTRWLQAGTDTREVDYRCTKAVDDETGRPFVVETAFVHRADRDGPRIITGINFSPCLVDPFRSLNAYGLSLEGLLGQLHVEDDSPVTFALHLVSPHLRFTDRGKSSLEGL